MAGQTWLWKSQTKDSKGQMLKEGMTVMLQNLESLKSKADLTVHEPWFISEWQASIDALDEAFALGFADVPLHVPSRCCRIVSCAPQRKVCSFSDDIQLYLGLDDEISAFSASLDRKDRPPPMRCATVPQI